MVCALVICWGLLLGVAQGATIVKRDSNGQDDESTLKMVHLIFRHGQRTPADTFPKDPYVNITFEPYGWGQLTNEGKMQQYEQGKWLRERYGKMLGDQYSSDLLQAMTTDVSRTKMSMQLMLAGLLPPAGPQVWNEHLLWQPIPYSHQILDQDKLLLVRSCPRYSEAMKELLQDPEVKKKVESYQELYDYLTEHTGMNIKDPEGVQDIYSTLKAEEDFKLALPEWTKTVYPEKMAEAAAYSFVLNVGNRELQKIKGGPLLKKILADSKAAAAGKSTKRVYAYAGHDSTISNLLMALKVWDTQIPVYNILIMAEVHQLPTHEYGLKVYLRNTTTHEPYALQLPGCAEVCPLDKVAELNQDILSDGLEKTCKPKDPSYVGGPDGGP